MKRPTISDILNWINPKRFYYIAGGLAVLLITVGLMRSCNRVAPPRVDPDKATRDRQQRGDSASRALDALKVFMLLLLCSFSSVSMGQVPAYLQTLTPDCCLQVKKAVAGEKTALDSLDYYRALYRTTWANADFQRGLLRDCETDVRKRGSRYTALLDALKDEGLRNRFLGLGRKRWVRRTLRQLER